MDQIGQDNPELPDLELEKSSYLTFFTLYKYRQIRTKPGHNIHDLKISDRFDHGSNRIRTIGVVCSYILKNC